MINSKRGAVRCLCLMFSSFSLCFPCIERVRLIDSPCSVRAPGVFRHGLVTSFLSFTSTHSFSSKFFRPMSSSSLSHSFYFLHVFLLFCSFHLGTTTDTSTRRTDSLIEIVTQGLFNSDFSNQSSDVSFKNHGKPSHGHSIIVPHDNQTTTTTHAPVHKNSSTLILI